MSSQGFIGIILLLVSVTTVLSGPVGQECDAFLEPAFEVFGQGSATDGLSLPVTVGQVNSDYCRDLKQRLVTLVKPRVCFKGFRRTAFDVILRGVKTFMKNNCKTKAAKEKVARHLRCFANQTTPTKELTDVLERATAVFDYAATQNGDQLIPEVCCAFGAVSKDVQMTAIAECDKKQISLQGKHFYAILMDDALAEIMDLTCGPFRSSDHCAAKLRNPKMYDDIIANPELTKTSDRLIESLFGLINAFDE
ncbi:hypothetical protein HDE_03817 [Halotydeus destructor]|nr:hypothetical protein HDE_03817 [Halotydeus destructor]